MQRKPNNGNGLKGPAPKIPGLTRKLQCSVSEPTFRWIKGEAALTSRSMGEVIEALTRSARK